jgi:hypothetical protein
MPKHRYMGNLYIEVMKVQMRNAANRVAEQPISAFLIFLYLHNGNKEKQLIKMENEFISA